MIILQATLVSCLSYKSNDFATSTLGIIRNKFLNSTESIGINPLEIKDCLIPAKNP